MRNIFLTLIATLTFLFSASAQEKKLEQVKSDLYAYTENSIKDLVHQTGFYQNINGELKREGEWKLYINGELRSEAIYKDDKIESLVIDGIEYSAKDLYIFRKENAINSLTVSN